MAVAAEALLRLKAVLDDEGFRKAQIALKDLDGQAKRTGGTIGGRVNRPIDQMDKGLQRINNSRPMQAVNRGLVATGAGLAGAVKLAVDFENEFSGVRKQLGLDPTSPILDSYRKQLLDLSTRTPTAVATLARIATEGAKIGLRGNPLMEYVNQIQMASKAMEIPAEELVGNFNGINAAMKLNPREGYKLLNVINALDDKLPANVNSRQILEAMSRVGSIPRVAGLKAQDTAALLAPIIGQNIAPEMAATGLKNFLLPLAGGGVALTKDKKNILAQLYGYDDPGLRFLKSQKGVIEKEIEDLKAKDGLVTNKVQQKLDKARLKELRGQLSGINKQIQERPGPGAYGGKIADDLARRMQIDPRGTIMEVIGKINQLPQEKRLGVVTELFGKESAPQIMALVNNAELLRKSFGIVDNEMKASIGSVKKEYDTLLQGAPAQLEMFKNALMAPAIEIGRTLLPALLELTRALKPMIDGFTDFVRKNPDAVTKFVQIAGAVAGLKIAMMGLGVVVSVLQGVGTAIRGLGTAATFLVNLPRTIAGTLGAVGPLLQKLKGMFAGLGGLGGNVGGALSTALRGGASGAGGFFSGLLTAARGLPAALMNALRGLSGVLIRALALDKAAIGLRTFFDTLRGFTPTMVMKGGQWVVPWTVRLATALRSILPVLGLVGRAVAGVFSGPVGWVALLITAGVALYTFRNQIGQFATWVQNKLSKAFQPIKDFALGKQQTQPGQPAQQTRAISPIDAILAPLNPTLLGARIGQAISQALAGLGPAWESFKQGISQGFNTALQGAFQGAASLFNTYFVAPIKGLWNFLVVWIGQTIAAYAILWWNKVTSGFQTYVVSPLQTMWTNFTIWLGNTFAGIQGRLSGIWVGVSTLFSQYVTTPISQWWNWLTNIITQGAANLRNTIAGWWAGISTKFQAEVVTPLQQMWTNFTNWLSEKTAPVRGFLGNMWNGLAQGFQERIVAPVQSLWNQLINGIQTKWTGTVQFFQNAWSAVTGGIMNGVITPLQNMFSNLASRIRATFDGLLGWARNIGNYIVDRVNPVRQAAGFQPLQRFARGGYVNGPTLGLIGEGRDPREYIIPERKMAGAAMNYLNGKRGASVLKGVPKFHEGGYITRSRGKKNNSMQDKQMTEWQDAQDKLYKQQADAMGMSLASYLNYTQEKQFGGSAKTNAIKAFFRNSGASPFYANERRNLGVSISRSAALDLLYGVNKTNYIISGGKNDITKIDYSWLRNQREAEKRYLKQFEIDSVNMSLSELQDKYGSQTALRMLSNIGAFARGGYVNKPTLGLIGEAGDNEYVIPERRMAQSSMAFLSGARGMDVVNPPRFANGGVVGSSVSNRSGNLNALLERTEAIGKQTVVVQEPTINATIQVQTGNVLQFEGQQYVTLDDYQRGLRQVQDKTLALMRSAQGRRATGR